MVGAVSIGMGDGVADVNKLDSGATGEALNECESGIVGTKSVPLPTPTA